MTINTAVYAGCGCLLTADPLPPCSEIVCPLHGLTLVVTREDWEKAAWELWESEEVAW